MVRLLIPFCKRGSDVSVKSKFQINISASYALNYLIYVQNTVSNFKKNSDSAFEQRYKFPLLNCDRWHLLNEDFELAVNDVWIRVLRYISSNPESDHNGIFEIEQNIFMELFQKDSNGEIGFRESWRSFTTWFDGYLGQYALERLIENNIVNDIYAKIEPHINSDKLMIILLYDEPLYIDDTYLTNQPNVLMLSIHQLTYLYNQTINQILSQYRV